MSIHDDEQILYMLMKSHELHVCLKKEVGDMFNHTVGSNIRIHTCFFLDYIVARHFATMDTVVYISETSNMD